MAKNIAKFMGFRLYAEQQARLAKLAKKLKISESELVRRAIEDFDPTMHLDSTTYYGTE